MKCAECPCLVYGCIYRFNGDICPYGVDNRLIKPRKKAWLRLTNGLKGKYKQR